jgi:hypothetical protein
MVTAATDLKNTREIPRLLLTRAEAAKCLSISLRYLDQLTKAGVIPCVFVHGAKRYATWHLVEWIDQQTEGSHGNTLSHHENPNPEARRSNGGNEAGTVPHSVPLPRQETPVHLFRGGTRKSG